MKNFSQIKETVIQDPDTETGHRETLALLLDLTGKPDPLTAADRLIEQGNDIASMLEGIFLGKVDEDVKYFFRTLARAKGFAEISYVRADNLRSIADVHDYCRRLLGRSPYEKLLFVCVSADNTVIGHRIYTGNRLEQVKLYPVQLIKTALNYRTAKVILVHSHPDGTSKPSQEDEDFTEKISLLLDTVGISLIEHLIVTKEGYFSFYGENMLKKHIDGE